MFANIDTAIGEAQTVHANNSGYFAILSKAGAKKSSQSTFPMAQLDEVVAAVKNSPDTYISQASFAYDSRQKVALKNLGCAFVDIDCYKLGIKPDDEFVSNLLDKATCYGIPHPSYIISSGRGIYLKWIFNSPISAAQVYRWDALQTALVTLYHVIGADMAARDVSRVLRIVGSTNSASGGCVTPIWQFGSDHDFNVLSEVVANVDLPQLKIESAVKLKRVQARIKQLQDGCPATARDIARQQKGTIEHLQTFSSQRQPIMLSDMSLLQLNWQRFIDLRDLAIMRGGINPGSRDLTLFWMGVFLGQSGIVTPDNFETEMSDLASGFPGQDFQPMQDGSMSSLLNRLKARQRGEKVIFNGSTYSSLYTPTNSKLIDIFEITPQEQASLSTIIDSCEKRVRSDAKVPGRFERREKRVEWRFKAVEIAKQAKTDGKEISVTEIAAQVGVHKTQVSRLLSGKIGQARKVRARVHRARAEPTVNYAAIYGIKAALGRGGALISPTQENNGVWAFYSTTVYPANPFKRTQDPQQENANEIQETHDPAFDLRALTPESPSELFQKNLEHLIPSVLASDALPSPSVAGFALSSKEESGRGVLGKQHDNQGFEGRRRFCNYELTPEPLAQAIPSGCRQTRILLDTLKSTTAWPTRAVRPKMANPVVAPPAATKPVAPAPQGPSSQHAYLNDLDDSALRAEVALIKERVQASYSARKAEDDAAATARAEFAERQRQVEAEKRQRTLQEKIEKLQSIISRITQGPEPEPELTSCDASAFRGHYGHQN